MYYQPLSFMAHSIIVQYGIRIKGQLWTILSRMN